MPVNDYVAEQVLEALGLAENVISVAQMRQALEEVGLTTTVVTPPEVIQEWYDMWHTGPPPPGSLVDLRDRFTAVGIGFTINGEPWTPPA